MNGARCGLYARLADGTRVLGCLGGWLLFLCEHLGAGFSSPQSPYLAALFLRLFPCQGWQRCLILFCTAPIVPFPSVCKSASFSESPLRLACLAGKVVILHPSPRQPCGAGGERRLPRRVGLMVRERGCWPRAPW